MTSTPALVTAVRSAKQFLTYVSAGPFQYAVAEALALPDSYWRATQGPQPVLAPSLNHNPDGNAPPRMYDAGIHRFPSARLRASAGAPGAWGAGGVTRSAAPLATSLA